METIKETTKNPSLIETMFQAGAHYGYSKTRRHPTYERFLFGAKERIDIIDLEKTSSYLSRALAFITETVQNGRVILFIGTKPEARRAVEEYVVPTGAPYMKNKWIGGTITNFSEIKKRIAHFLDLRAKVDKGELEMYTKKERLLFDRELQKLEFNLGGIADLKDVPHVVFIIDPKEESTAVREARRKGIPIVALAGTDCNLEEIDYPIPANDSSLASISFFVEKIADVYRNAKDNLKPLEDTEKAGVE